MEQRNNENGFSDRSTSNLRRSARLQGLQDTNININPNSIPLGEQRHLPIILEEANQNLTDVGVQPELTINTEQLPPRTNPLGPECIDLTSNRQIENESTRTRENLPAQSINGSLPELLINGQRQVFGTNKKTDSGHSFSNKGNEPYVPTTVNSSRHRNEFSREARGMLDRAYPPINSKGNRRFSNGHNNGRRESRRYYNNYQRDSGNPPIHSYRKNGSSNNPYQSPNNRYQHHDYHSNEKSRDHDYTSGHRKRHHAEYRETNHRNHRNHYHPPRLNVSSNFDIPRYNGNQGPPKNPRNLTPPSGPFSLSPSSWSSGTDPRSRSPYRATMGNLNNKPGVSDLLDERSYREVYLEERPWMDFDEDDRQDEHNTDFLKVWHRIDMKEGDRLMKGIQPYNPQSMVVDQRDYTAWVSTYRNYLMSIGTYKGNYVLTRAIDLQIIDESLEMLGRDIPYTPTRKLIRTFGQTIYRRSNINPIKYAAYLRIGKDRILDRQQLFQRVADLNYCRPDLPRIVDFLADVWYSISGHIEREYRPYYFNMTAMICPELSEYVSSSVGAGGRLLKPRRFLPTGACRLPRTGREVERLVDEMVRIAATRGPLEVANIFGDRVGSYMSNDGRFGLCPMREQTQRFPMATNTRVREITAEDVTNEPEQEVPPTINLVHNEAVVCSNCNKKGHTEEVCWKKHPELIPQHLLQRTPGYQATKANNSGPQPVPKTLTGINATPKEEASGMNNNLKGGNTVSGSSSNAIDQTTQKMAKKDKMWKAIRNNSKLIRELHILSASGSDSDSQRENQKPTEQNF